MALKIKTKKAVSAVQSEGWVKEDTAHETTINALVAIGVDKESEGYREHLSQLQYFIEHSRKYYAKKIFELNEHPSTSYNKLDSVRRRAKDLSSGLKSLGTKQREAIQEQILLRQGGVFLAPIELTSLTDQLEENYEPYYPKFVGSRLHQELDWLIEAIDVIAPPATPKKKLGGKKNNAAKDLIKICHKKYTALTGIRHISSYQENAFSKFVMIIGDYVFGSDLSRQVKAYIKEIKARNTDASK